MFPSRDGGGRAAHAGEQPLQIGAVMADGIAPEFFDQAIFRNFIQTLSKAGLLRNCDSGTLVSPG